MSSATISSACVSSTTPLNISILKKSGTCDTKCDYSFKYNSSYCVVNNNSTYISVAYDAGNSPQVTYNTRGYNVKELRIYSPSAHTYGITNKQQVAEIVIIHSPVNGGNNLIVSVPARSDEYSSTSKGSLLINSIILGTAKNAPDAGETATLSLIKPFTLNDVVPSKTYFSYTGQDAFYNCSQTVDYIVFTPENSNISITSDTLKQLNQIITNSQIASKAPSDTVPLFINENGPNNSTIDDEIYIDCQPVGNSSETEDVVKNTSYDPSPINAKDIFKSPWFQIIASALGFLLILIVLSKIFSSKTMPNTNIMSKPSSKMIS
jgi:carbonic anhydrase